MNKVQMTLFSQPWRKRFCNGAAGGTGTYCQPLQFSLTNGNNDDVKANEALHYKICPGKPEFAVQEMSNQELVDNLYTKMAEFSSLNEVHF